MKMKELLSVVERIAKDTAPRAAFYASSLREHMHKRHKDLLEEEITLE